VSDVFAFAELGDNANQPAMEVVKSGISRIVNSGEQPNLGYGNAPDAQESLRRAIFVLLIQSYIINDSAATALTTTVAPDRLQSDQYWLQPKSGVSLEAAITEAHNLLQVLRERLIVEVRCPEELRAENPAKPHASVLHMVPYGIKLSMIYNGLTIHVHSDSDPEWLANEARRIIRDNVVADHIGPLPVY
jgi:hypothetical protein